MSEQVSDKAEQQRSWVWVSSYASRETGQISILAIAETLASVALYWWIAVTFETAALLLASPFVAALVLFRSPQSVAMGLQLGETYFTFDERSSPRQIRRIRWSGYCAGALGLIVFLLVYPGDEISATTVFWAVLAVCVAIATGNSLYGLDALIALNTNKIFTDLYLASGVLTAIAAYLMVQASADNAQTLLADILFILFPTFVVVPFVAYWLGFFLGICFRFLAIRLWSVLYNLKPGILAFAGNWRRTALGEDMLSPPQMLPGTQKADRWSIEQMVFRRGDHLIDWSERIAVAVLAACAFVFWFLPNILFRITLKSTAWLYLPLIWIAHVPAHLRSDEGRVVWVGYQGRRLLDWLAFGTALATLIAAAVLAFDLGQFRSTIAAAEGRPLGLGLVFALDLSQLPLWYWVTLPAAALTVGLALWLDHIRKVNVAGGAIAAAGPQMRALIATHRLRSGLALLWMVITLMSFAQIAWELGQLPDWMGPVIRHVVQPVTALWTSGPVLSPPSL